MLKRFLSSISSLSVIIITLISCTSTTPGNESDDNDSTVHVIFTESNDLFVNPERGFYSHNSFSTQDNNVLTVEQVISNRKAGRSLMLTLYYLYDFRDKAISNEYLNRIETNMKALRKGGAKCVLRFAYSDGEDNKPWDATPEIVLQHIKQLKPYLENYADVIYTMEAGFVGIWGEWYYTDNFIMNPQSSQDFIYRKQVLEALLNSLPKDRMVAVRTPSYKLKSFNLSYSDTITQLKAFNGSNLSRLGAHNDCFLATSNDMGTFNNTQERQFWENESKYTIMGGETCGLSSYSSCENALLQMEKYHWSYINSDYHPGVLSDWRTKGCLNEISRRLGYCFMLTEGEFTKKPIAGKNFKVKIKIKNVGFASPVNPRNVEIVFASENNTNETYKLSLDTDPRKWYPGNEYTLDITYTLPIAMKGKKIDVFLNLSDPIETLKDRPEYSIRLANTNVWDSETGYNKLFTISVE